MWYDRVQWTCVPLASQPAHQLMTSIPSSPATEPPALTALRDYPLLLNAVAPSMTQQAAQLLTHAAHFIGRQSLLQELHSLIDTLDGGLIAVEGMPGSGVTSLLSYLAATQAWAFWFSETDTRQGATALAAQLIALHRLSVPLIPPAVQRDPATLERFLSEAATHATREQPIVILVDAPGSMLQPGTPFPLPLPGSLPPHVLVLYGCVPGAPVPLPPVARVRLPQTGSEVVQDQVALLRRMACPAGWIAPILGAAHGNMLYLALACGLLRSGLLTAQALTPGLEALHRAWWDSLDETGQRLALLLAAAGEAMPMALCATLLGTDPQPWLTAWDAAGFVQHTSSGARLAHWITREYLARQQRLALAQIHTDVVMLASVVLDVKGLFPENAALPRPGALPQADMLYLVRQFSRHAALGTPATRLNMLPRVTERAWVLMQQRRDDTRADAAYDLAWELRHAAAVGPAVRLARSAALAGTLSSRSRMLSPDAAIAALTLAIEHLGREPGLKQVRSLVDQLPDDQEKALILRQLGEACYGLQMRSAAMRLLSQALDIEEHKQPVVWREQREQLLAALAAQALERGEDAIALEIGGRIGHIERRGMVETQVVRWLLLRGMLVQAQELALRIQHESLGAWAQAEVAIYRAQAGDLTAAEALLAQVQVETARAWAQIKLACQMAAQDELAARLSIDLLDSPHQRDRGLAELARALAQADKDGDALDAAAQIGDVAMRVATLLDLRLMLEGLVAMLALEQATAVVGRLPGDVRVPLTAMLAASFAAIGRRTEALRVAEQLEEGEERDRALSRVAVALGRRGDYDEAFMLARALSDEDERDWTLDELARVLAEAGRWEAAHELCTEISNAQQRAETMADLVIARARAGEALLAVQLAATIPSGTDYARALTLIAPLLVAQGHSAIALSIIGIRSPGNTPQASDTWNATSGQVVRAVGSAPDSAATWNERQTLPPPQVSRYLATVVTALAEQGAVLQARQIAHTIRQPLDRGRAYLGIALAMAQRDAEQACADLGIALHGALIGRDEAFRLLEQATPVFAALGGATLLQTVAAAIDEVDTW